MNGGWGISYGIALRWMPLDLTDDKSTLVQVMTWCRQATSHNLTQCWPRSMSSNGVTSPQWLMHWEYQYLVHLIFLWYRMYVSANETNCISQHIIQYTPFYINFIQRFMIVIVLIISNFIYTDCVSLSHRLNNFVVLTRMFSSIRNIVTAIKCSSHKRYFQMNLLQEITITSYISFF